MSSNKKVYKNDDVNKDKKEKEELTNAPPEPEQPSKAPQNKHSDSKPEDKSQTEDDSIKTQLELERSTPKADIPKVSIDPVDIIKNEVDNSKYKIAVNIAPDLEKLSEAQFVRPAAVKIYSDYNVLNSLTTDQFTPQSSYQVTLVSEVQHFLKIFINNDAGTPTHNKYVVYDNLPNVSIFNESRTVFSDGVKLALLGIDCNRAGAQIILDPFSPDLLQTEALSSELELLSLAVHNGRSTNITAENTILKYLALAVYINRVSSFIGNFMYVANDEISDVISTMTSRNEHDPSRHISFNSIIDSTNGKSFYAYRLDYPTTLTNLMRGNLPNDDYIRYPRPEFMRQFLPMEWARNFMANNCEFPRLGTIAEGVNNIVGHKISEFCHTGSDPIISQLQVNAFNYLDTIQIKFVHVQSLLNAMLMKRDDLKGDDFNNMKYYTCMIGSNNLPKEYTRFFTFPYSKEHVHAFKIIEVHSSTSRLRMFQHLTNHATRLFSAFPPESVQEFQDSLKDSNTMYVNTAIGPQLNPLLTPLSELRVDENVLGLKLALDLLPQYNIINVSNNFNDNVDMNPIQFLVHLTSLLVSKYMYYQTWCYNQAVWYNHVYNFLNIYFPVEIRAHYDTYAFGTDGTTRLVQTPDMNRMNDPIINYSFSSQTPLVRAAHTNTQFINDLITILCLRTNSIGSFEQINFGGYGISSSNNINGRRYYKPGDCYAPVNAMNRETKPITKILLTVFDIHGPQYIKIRQHLNPTKNYQAAVASVSPKLVKYAHRFGEWFHCVYCPIYVTLSRSPYLTRDSVTHDSPLCKSQPAAFDSSASRKIMSPIPAYLPFVNSQTNMYGKPQLIEAWNMFATLYAPGCTHAPDAPNRPVVPQSEYGTLYSPIFANDALSFYKEELIRRHTLLESIYAANSIVDGSMFTAMPVVSQALFDKYLLSSLPMISYIYLGNAVGNMNPQNDSQLKMYSKDYHGLVPRELRIMQPSICLVTADNHFSPMLNSHITGIDITRPHIKNNRDLLMKYLFGKLSLRPLSQGLTISRQKIKLPITFTTTHDVPANPIDIRVAGPPQEELLAHRNRAHVLPVAASIGNTHSTVVLVDPNRPDTLKQKLHDAGFPLPPIKPYYRIVVNTQPNYVLDLVLNFYYQLYLDGSLIMINTHIYSYPYSSIDTPNEVNEDSPLTYTEFVDLHNATIGTLLPMKNSNTTMTTNELVMEYCQINKLQMNPTLPVIVASGLTGDGVHGPVNPYFNDQLIVEPGFPARGTQTLKSNPTVPILNRHPYAMNTLEVVHMLPPVEILPVMISEHNYSSY